MDNREIFNFDFVDRTIQRDIIFNYFQKTDNYLWIDGESGVGKTFFVENVILNDKSFHNIVYIKLSPKEESNNCFSEFIKKLQEISGVNFISFWKDNIDTVLDITKKSVLEIVKMKIPILDWFCNVLYDSDLVFLKKNKEKIGSLKIVEMFVDKIIHDKMLCIIFDNFTYCDKKSIELLIQFFYHYIKVPNFKAIFITTSEILDNRIDIQKMLTEQLPVRRMKLPILEEIKYFYVILDNIFDLNNIIDILPSIYEICNGNPERLKSLIRKLYINDGIILPRNEHSKALICENKLKNILINKSLDLTNTDITENERFIMQIMLSFGDYAPLSIFQKCILFIHKKLFYGSIWSIIQVNNIIQSLINKNIFEKENNKSLTIKFVHDKIYFGVKLLLSDEMNKSMISHYFYEYLITYRETLSNELSNFEYLKIYHSYIAQEPNWYIENYSYAENKCKQKNYIDAIHVFKILIAENVNLLETQKLTIAEAFYETGDYYNAKSILKNINFEELSKIDIFKYYFLLGKVENVILNKAAAIQYYDLALKFAYSREDQILILHSKHLSLLENMDGKKEAKTIFDSIALNLSEDEKQMLSVCYLLRNCNQFYTGKKAKEFFMLALKIAIEKGTPADEGYVHNNYGLELFRTGHHSDAYAKFFKSYDILKETKYHESAYPLNNLAVCKIFKSEYEQAVEYLMEAQYVNQSIYAGLAIKVHLMTCYRFMHKDDQCQKYMTQLKDYLENEKIFDLNIIRKLSINLCISYMHYRDNVLAKDCLKKCIKYVPNTISEFRCYTLNNQLNLPYKSTSNAMQSNIYYTRLDFEPWIITLSHD